MIALVKGLRKFFLVEMHLARRASCAAAGFMCGAARPQEAPRTMSCEQQKWERGGAPCFVKKNQLFLGLQMMR